jgi:hypothetical protein
MKNQERIKGKQRSLGGEKQELQLSGKIKLGNEKQISRDGPGFLEPAPQVLFGIR